MSIPRNRALRQRATAALRAAVWVRDQGVCQLCWKPIRPGQLSTLDHIKPSSHGGSTIMSNCQLAHKSCNQRRGTMPVAAFRALLKAELCNSQSRNDITDYCADTPNSLPCRPPNGTRRAL